MNPHFKEKRKRTILLKNIFMPEKIINPKPPTKKDLLMLEYMKSGGIITNENAYSLWKVIGTRDAIYRLNCAGYGIKHRDIDYTDGSGGWFRQWFLKTPEVIAAGVRTEKTSFKGTKTLTEISKNIQNISAKVRQEYNGNNLFNIQTS